MDKACVSCAMLVNCHLAEHFESFGFVWGAQSISDWQPNLPVHTRIHLVLRRMHRVEIVLRLPAHVDLYVHALLR